MSEERKESAPKERKEESGTKERKIVYLPAHEVEEEEGGEWADTKIGLYHNTGDGWRLVSKTPRSRTTRQQTGPTAAGNRRNVR